MSRKAAVEGARGGLLGGQFGKNSTSDGDEFADLDVLGGGDGVNLAFIGLLLGGRAFAGGDAEAEYVECVKAGEPHGLAEVLIQTRFEKIQIPAELVAEQVDAIGSASHQVL